MDLRTCFNVIRPFVPFFLLSLFHIFIRPKILLVWMLSYTIGFILLVLVISFVLFAICNCGSALPQSLSVDLFANYKKFRSVFRRPHILSSIVVCFVFRFLYLVHVELRGYYWYKIYLSLIVLFCSLQNMTNWYMVSKLRWIRRECRLLGAVCDDISKVLRVIEKKHATRSLMSNLSPERSVPPREVEKLETWVKSTKEVVHNARQIIEGSLDCMQHFLSRQFLFLHLSKFDSTSNDLLSKSESAYVKGIYDKLDDWRFMYQILEDMAVEDESGYEIRTQLVRQVSAIIKQTAENVSQDRRRKIKLKLKLLEAFLIDLTHVKLESAIERAWLEEMKDFLDDVNKAFDNFRRINNGFGLHQLLGEESLRAKLWLDWDVGWMAEGLTELLKVKKNLGFKFTIVHQQTQPHQNKNFNENPILPVVSKIRDLFPSYKGPINIFEEEDTEADPKIMKQCSKLEEMHESLKAMDIASNFRSVCLEQLNKTDQKLKDAIQNYIEDTYSATDKRETSTIDSRINDLEIFIQAHTGKARRKYCSVIGLEEDMDKLIPELWAITGGSVQRRIISIVGMQGIGKSTLASKVFHQISHHFELYKWVTVPNIPNDTNAVLKAVGNEIMDPNLSQQQEEGEMKESYNQRIHSFLQQQRYLIVLDGVPTMEVWNVLSEIFPDVSNSSRILLTTRDQTLASHVDSTGKPHQLRLRTRDESLKIFLEKTSWSAEPLPQNAMLDNSVGEKHEKLIREAKKIVDRCWGLPSLIGTSTSRNTKDSPLLSGANEPVDQCQTLWPCTLQISGLPELALPLSYFTLFPKSHEISARRLIALWVAEELVQEDANDTTKTLENIAEDYLLQLIGLNIIQPVEKSVHGKVRTCRLPHPLCNQVSDLAARTFSREVRLVDHCNSQNDTYKLIHEDSPHNWRYGENPVSLVSFVIHRGDKPGRDIGNFLDKGIANGCFAKLKVLDLERVFRPQLHKSIGKLAELKYLGLRWTYLEKIPSTIGHLSKLQTLDLKRTDIRNLPVTIWNLQELRHLYLNQTYQRTIVHQSKTKFLNKLQTLWGVRLDKDSHLKNRLGELKSLRKLGLAFQLSLEDQRELAKSIACLKSLQTLRLESVDVLGIPLELYMGNFSELQDLSNMVLYGKLHNALSSSNFPKALTELTLSASGLEYDPMQILQKLPKLKSLCLFSNSFAGKHMVCSMGSFSQLLVLKIWKLECLEDWTIKEGAMKNLKELEIRSCSRLNVPDGLRHLKTLRRLKLRNMPDPFSTSCSILVKLSIIEEKQD